MIQRMLKILRRAKALTAEAKALAGVTKGLDRGCPLRPN
jgi:hypothetical protein